MECAVAWAGGRVGFSRKKDLWLRPGGYRSRAKGSSRLTGRPAVRDERRQSPEPESLI